MQDAVHLLHVSPAVTEIRLPTACISNSPHSRVSRDYTEFRCTTSPRK